MVVVKRGCKGFGGVKTKISDIEAILLLYMINSLILRCFLIKYDCGSKSLALSLNKGVLCK